jgi:ParB-like chromosome segregation protein Spo0J
MNWVQEAAYTRVREERIKEAPFCLSWGFDPGPLTRSLERLGLVSPLVVRPHQGGYQLICGYRRLLALRALGQAEIAAWVLPAETPATDLLDIALLENLSHRTFNEAEKALAVSYLAGLHPPDRVAQHYLPLLGLSPREETRKRYLTLAGLGPAALTLLSRGRLDPETALSLEHLAGPERDALLDLLDRLGASRSKQRQIVAWLDEIGRREGRSVAEVLAEPPARAVLDDDRLVRAEKEKRLRAYLYSRRFPERSRLEARQVELAAGLKLPANLRLDLPQAFEGLDFQVRLLFSSRTEFEAGLRALGRLAGRPELDALLDLG